MPLCFRFELSFDYIEAKLNDKPTRMRRISKASIIAQTSGRTKNFQDFAGLTENLDCEVQCKFNHITRLSS